MSKEFTLRNQIEENKTWYEKKYGKLDWQWTDEGLPYTIQDYHSCKGSVLDFTDDDWAVAAEHGWSREEIEMLCRDEETGEV